MDYTKGEWNCTCDAGYKGEVYHCPLHAAAYDMYEALKEADEVICDLCKRLNPQHILMDYGKGCEWCQDRDIRLKAIKKVEGRDG